MQKVWGVVAEFNPFHNGHRALIQAAREQGAGYLVAAMSGHVVQRGEFAAADKWTRTRCALGQGVDLVVEIPAPWACSTARRYAKGAVELLRACGVVEGLCFGSESGDAVRLQQAMELAESPAVRRLLPGYLAQGLTFAAARRRAAGEVDADLAALLDTPNNNLAIEYLRAAAELGWKPDLFTLRRLGAGHDAAGTEGEFASASHIRSLGGGLQEAAGFLPAGCLHIVQEAVKEGLYPASPWPLEQTVLSALRRLSLEQLRGLPDISEGLEHRLAKAIREVATLSQLLGMIKTKRYPLARVRRLVLCAYLGITRGDVEGPLPYLRILGFSPRGEELVRRMKRSAALPMDSRFARLAGLGERQRRIARLEALVTDLYALCLPAPRRCGWEYTAKGIFQKSGDS